MIFSLGGPSLSFPLRPAPRLALPLTVGRAPTLYEFTAMQVARKVPTDDPQVLFYLRIAYISIRSSAPPLLADEKQELVSLTADGPTDRRAPHRRRLRLHLVQGPSRSAAPLAAPLSLGGRARGTDEYRVCSLSR